MLFKSWAYGTVFRIGMAYLFCGVALKGLGLSCVRGLDSERAFILAINVGCCGVLGVWNFWIGGFFSVPALSEVEQQSLIVAFMGEQLSSICLVALRLIRLVDRLSGAAKRPHLRVYYAAVAVVFCASLVFTWCILSEALYIYDVQREASAVYAASAAVAAGFYFTAARRYLVQLGGVAGCDELGPEVTEKLRAVFKDVVRAGCVLAATSVSIVMLGLPALMRPSTWPVLWVFYWVCRAALSLCIMRLASPWTNKIKRKELPKVAVVNAARCVVPLDNNSGPTHDMPAPASLF